MLLANYFMVKFVYHYLEGVTMIKIVIAEDNDILYNHLSNISMQNELNIEIEKTDKKAPISIGACATKEVIKNGSSK